MDNPTASYSASDQAVEIGLEDIFSRCLPDVEGNVADYIPELAKVTPGQFGISLATMDGRLWSRGEDTYLTTVGVKIDKKTLDVGGRSVSLILWDIAGEDDVSSIRMSYVRGAAGYLLVVDGTRPETLEVALSIQARVESEVGKAPFALLLNKHDLKESWAISDLRLAEPDLAGWMTHPTSAKTGAGVEAAFEELARRIAE